MCMARVPRGAILEHSGRLRRSPFSSNPGGSMRSTRWAAVVFLAAAPLAAEDKTPALQHFDATQVDRSVDPCDDFFQYACGAFTKANPIPPDQVYWGKASPLQLWNQGVLRDTLAAA